MSMYLRILGHQDNISEYLILPEFTQLRPAIRRVDQHLSENLSKYEFKYSYL